MNRRIILSVGGATAGLLTTTFLPVTVALADNSVGTVGDIGSTNLPVDLTSSVAGPGGAAPVGHAGGLGPELNSPAPTGLGTALAPHPGTPSPSPLGDIGGLSPTSGISPTAGLAPSPGLPPTSGTPDATHGAGTPGDTTPVDTTPGGTTPGGTTPESGDNFTIGDTTFHPVQADGSEGFTPVSPLFSAPPLFQVGEGDQSFDITGGSGKGATDLGSATASENVTNLAGGIHNTEFTITSVDPASSATAGSDLPTVGTVYDVMNLGHGFENVYTDIPGADGAANSITDTLATPFGDFNIPTDFNAAGLLDPGDAFSGASSLGADAADAASGASGAAADAAGGAADAAGGAADAAGMVDPLSMFGI